MLRRPDIERLLILGAIALLAIAAPASAVASHEAKSPPETLAVLSHPSDPAVKGGSLFAAQCARCHGVRGRGDGPDAQFFVRPPRDLRSGFLELYTDEELVARIRDGTPLRLELDPKATRARTHEVTELLTFLPRLPDIDWKKVEPGNEIFLDRCEMCHGPFGRPAPGMTLPRGVQRPPRDLSSPEFQRSVSDRELIDIVRHGRKGMPAIPALQSGGDAALLVAYVRTLSPGRELYGAYCAGCHGEDGRGSSGVPGAEGPTVVFDRAYFERKSPEDLGRDVWHMLDQQGPQMPHLARRLSPDDAVAIVAYLRRSEPAPRRTASPPAARP
jgi:mono/diheme cytochrome c family protein